MIRCPACARYLRLLGILSRPQLWLRWQVCDACQALFVSDEQGSPLFARPAIDRAGFPWLPPRAWFRPAGADLSTAFEPTADLISGADPAAALTALLARIERTRRLERLLRYGARRAAEHGTRPGDATAIIQRRRQAAA